MVVLVRFATLERLSNADEPTRVAAGEAEGSIQADKKDREQGYIAHRRNW